MTQESRLVSEPKLLEVLFDNDSRPSLSFLRRLRTRRAIPFLKVGGKVLYDSERVREALTKNFTVNAR